MGVEIKAAGDSKCKGNSGHKGLMIDAQDSRSTCMGSGSGFSFALSVPLPTQVYKWLAVYLHLTREERVISITLKATT